MNSIEEVNVKDQKSSEIVGHVPKIEDEWVEYVDDLGRTRVCRKKDLPGYQQQQQQEEEEGKPQTSGSISSNLSDNTIRTEEKRQEWEQQAAKQMLGAYDADVLHYDPETGR